MVLSMMACLLGESTQLSFASIRPFGPCNSRVGFARLSASGKDVPIARTMTFFGCVPVMMNPPMRTLSPVSTRRRVEMLASVVMGAALGVGVGGGVAEGTGVGVGAGGLLPNS